MESAEGNLQTVAAPELAEAGSYANAAEGFDHGLVVLALGFPYWLEHYDESYRLLVERAHLEIISEQLQAFDRESLGWPPVFGARSASPRRAGVFSPLFWGLLVLAIFWAQQRSPGILEKAGELDSQAVIARHEGWRTFTALFLHADASHLAANWMSGIFVFSALIGTFGFWRGWSLLALASVAGNFGVAALHYPEPYRSLGASTAIFAALGLLTGNAARVALRAGATQRLRRIFIPLASGFTLLALFGAGGLRTDLGAHVSGFLAGMLLGFAVATPSEKGPVLRAAATGA